MEFGKYSIGYGTLGNGLTFWNRNREVSGDYDKIAHVDAHRVVTFYKKRLPQELRDYINNIAKTSNPSVSTSQPDIKVFLKEA